MAEPPSKGDGPPRVKPPPLSRVKAQPQKGMLEKQVMGDGRYSTLFRATSFELFVPKNKVRCAPPHRAVSVLCRRNVLFRR